MARLYQCPRAFGTGYSPTEQIHRFKMAEEWVGNRGSNKTSKDGDGEHLRDASDEMEGVLMGGPIRATG